MTTTDAPLTPTRTDPGDVARRTAAVAAALLGVGLFMTVAVIDVPHEASDQVLLSWWQESGNRMAGVLSGLSALLVAATAAVVVNYVSSLRTAGRSPHWLGFARSMAAAVTALWAVTGAARATVGHLVDTMNEPLPGVDVLRFATALNYTLLGLSGMGVLALFMLALSVVVLRTDALGRSVGYVGVGCSVLMLVAVLAQYGAYTSPLAILWALWLAVALWRQPAAQTLR